MESQHNCSTGVPELDASSLLPHPNVPAPDRATETQPLSKNAQKKLAKAARFAEQKKERRVAEKVRRKERRRIQAEKRAAGELEDAEDGSESRKKRKVERREPFGAQIVVDLGFDEMMTDQEVKSLVSQLAYTYSANRKATCPFSPLLFTSLNGRTQTRLESLSDAAYKRWVGSEFWTEGYERLWEAKSQDSSDTHGTEHHIEKPEEIADLPEQGFVSTPEVIESAGNQPRRWHAKPHATSKENVVYLTADSEEELTELKEGETYIIGGIVDHNRYKNLCLKKAQDAGVRSARLPIGTYLAELKTRKVLTVNQTFDILLRWVETRDWEKALWEVIPKRKFQDKGKVTKGSEGDKSGAIGDGDEDEDVAEDADITEVVIDAEALEDGREDAEVNDAVDHPACIESPRDEIIESNCS